MDKKRVLLIFLSVMSSPLIHAELPDFCKTGEYICHQVSPDYVVAFPNNGSTHPSPQKTAKVSSDGYKPISANESKGKDLIDIDLTALTWSAYDNNGELAGSGRVSGGKEYCADIDSNCETVTGIYTIFRKGEEDCKSTIYPVGKGGAPMPYCMFFHGGYALHGSNSVPNYNASHGCVRMSRSDAQWLNEEFVIEGLTKVHTHY
ncbi:MAG: L,D-transpeptidase [Candidatus Berkiella sp.]